MFRVTSVLVGLLTSSAVPAATAFQSLDDPVYARTQVDRQAMREATARWWIVGISELGMLVVERQKDGERAPAKLAWSQMVYASPENGSTKTMLQDSYDCSKGTYTIVRQIEFDSRGRTLADGTPPLKKVSPAPGTFGESAMTYVCKPGSTLPGPFPLARDEVSAAKIAALLMRFGEDVNASEVLASLDPVQDRAQIRYILTHTIRPAHRAAVSSAIGVTIGLPPRDPKRR